MSLDWVGRGDEDMLCGEHKEVPVVPTMCRGHLQRRSGDEPPVDHKRPEPGGDGVELFHVTAVDDIKKEVVYDVRDVLAEGLRLVEDANEAEIR